jgi:hypothetical protein
VTQPASNTIKDAAAWMLRKLNENGGTLYQEEAALALQQLFGEGVTYINDNGGLAIAPSVLRAFRLFTNGIVIWVRPERYWRRRESSDEPGRRVSDY